MGEKFMESTTTGRRSYCQRCLRPTAACVCVWIRSVPSDIEVAILQHPLERDNPKGTARLLHLSLPNSTLQIGEQFSPDRSLYDSKRTTLLLYPALAGDSNADVLAPVDATPALGAKRLHLIVLDGTWRKSRKMLILNPWLRTLPRLALHHLPLSRYRIRIAAQPDHLSTLEATCHALLQLGQPAAPIERLLDAFVALMNQLAAQTPRTSSRDTR